MGDWNYFSNLVVWYFAFNLFKNCFAPCPMKNGLSINPMYKRSGYDKGVNEFSFEEVPKDVGRLFVVQIVPYHRFLLILVNSFCNQR